MMALQEECLCDQAAAEIARLQAELDGMRTAFAAEQQVSMTLADELGKSAYQSRAAARQDAETIARLREALTEIGREQSAVSATVAADKFQSLARAALSPRPPEAFIEAKRERDSGWPDLAPPEGKGE